MLWWEKPPRWQFPLPEHTAVLDARARAVISEWDQRHPAVTDRRYVPVRPWAPELPRGWTFVSGRDEAAEHAIGGNRLRAASQLGTTPPANASVRWDDGAVAEVPLVSATEALTAVNAEPCRHAPCGTAVHDVVGAELGTIPVRTAHGWASVPAWLFTIEQTSARIARIALAPDRAPDRFGEAFQAPDVSYERISHAILMPTNSTTDYLSVEFPGAPPGNGPCSGQYTAHAIEGAASVVVVVQPMRRTLRDPQVICDHFLTPYGPFQQLTVVLSRPLGERVLLDVSDGLPRTVMRPAPL